MSIFLWLVFFLNGDSSHQYSSSAPQGDNVAASCVDDNRDGACDGVSARAGVDFEARTTGGGVGFGN